MKNKKIRFDFVMGVALIVLLIGGCCVYQWWKNRHEIVSTVIPIELAREATIEKIYDPKDMVTYMIQAAEMQDLDMALRGFPIDEQCLAVNTAKIVEKANVFSNSVAIAPSGWYLNYFPISSVELTGNLAESYDQFVQGISEYGKLEIESIDYARPDIQSSSEYQQESSELCETWGAKKSTELCVLLTDGTKYYVTGMTMIRYDDYWKVFALNSKLTGITEGKPCIPITKSEYDKLTVRGKEQGLQKILEGDDTKKQQKEWAEKEKEVKEVLESEEALLTPNYFVVNRNYGDTPEDLIEQFTLYLQRYDLTSMLNYGNGDTAENPEHITVEQLCAQKDFAIQIKNFYFNLLRGKSGTKKITLEELGQSAEDTVGETNPDQTFYMDLMSVKEKDKDTGEYIVSYWYGGDAYKVEFFLKESESGWWIDAIGVVKKVNRE